MKRIEKAAPEIGDRLLRIREAAALLAISERQIWHLIESGRLLPIRLGRSTRLRASDIRRLIDAGHDAKEVGEYRTPIQREGGQQ